MRTAATNSRLFARLLVGGLLTLTGASCNNDGDIAALDSGNGFSLQQGKNDKNSDKVKKKSKSSNGQLEQDGETEGGLNTDDPGNDPGDERSQPATADTSANPTSAAPIEYPTMSYNAKGLTTCKGDTYNTTATINTGLTTADLTIDMVAGKIFCGGKCQKEADKQIATSIGMTRYKRATKDQKKTANVDAAYAIFAMGVTKERNKQTFNFDKPLPVFPWPGAKPFYAALDAGPQTFAAHVTGFRAMDVTVEVSKVSEDGDTMKILFVTTIAQDKGGHGWYEDFPIPREALYTISMGQRDVRQIKATNWFNGEKCDNKAEQVGLTYKMCKKIKKGVPESFPCN